MIVSTRSRALAFPAVVALAIAALSSASLAADAPASGATDTVEINAFSTVTADAKIIQSGASTAALVGTLSGTLYIDGEKGPVAQGDLSCVGSFDLSLEDGSQKGSGTCSLSSEDGAQAFGTWTCEGYHLVGCQGPFKVTGGTGRLAGITGEGPVTIRSNFHALAETAGGQVAQTTEGIVFWRKLKLTMPAQPAE